MNIKENNLGNGGIILIKEKDKSVNSLCKLMGLEFNLIGFYYKINDHCDYKFILIDIFYLEDDMISHLNGVSFSHMKLEKVAYKRLLIDNTKFIKKLDKFSFQTNFNKKEVFAKLLEGQMISFNIFNKFMLTFDNSLIPDNKIDEMLFDSTLFSPLTNYELLIGGYVKKELIESNHKEFNKRYYENIKNYLEEIYNDIKSKKLAYIKYNEIIYNFNMIYRNIDKNHKDLKLLENESSYHCLIVSNDMNMKDIPLLLKNGKKIFIPMSEYDYSRYSVDELDEMLTILDVYSVGDNKFDEIRTLITKELAKKI